MYAALATVSISDYEKARRVLHDDLGPPVDGEDERGAGLLDLLHVLGGVPLEGGERFNVFQANHKHLSLEL